MIGNAKFKVSRGGSHGLLLRLGGDGLCFGSCGFACFGVGHLVDVINVARLVVFGQKALANLCHFIGVVRFSEQCERFSQNGVVLFGDDKWCSHVGLERLFHLLDLDFDAPAAHHIVDAAEYAKAIVTELSLIHI